MPKMPRNISGRELCRILGKHDYSINRQVGSHIRLISNKMGNQHAITIPDHNPLKIGTLNKILKDVADYLKTNKDFIITDCF